MNNARVRQTSNERRPRQQGALPALALGRRHRPDYVLMLCMVMLLAFGLIVIYSVSPAISAQLKGDADPNHFMYRQILYLLLGFGTFSVTSLLPLQVWERLQKYILWAAVISFGLLFIPALSLNYGGATRWVHIGPFSYQPAELLKFGLIFWLASFFAQQQSAKKLNDRRTTNVFLLVLAAVGLEIVILQRDMGTMIPIAAIMLSILYVSGIAWQRFAKIIVVIVVAGVLAIAAAPHRMARVFTFLNPDADTSGSGYHINQALIAVGSGGMFGKGLGRSVQAYGYLPEAANDSIFAIMAEKFGYVGMLVVFAIYGVLLFRIIHITTRAPNMYLRLVCAGIFAWLAVQAFVNMGAMLGIMPLTGVTLPFLSFGGTSLVFTLAALGVVFNISRYTKLGYEAESNASYENSDGRRRVGRPRYAA